MISINQVKNTDLLCEAINSAKAVNLHFAVFLPRFFRIDINIVIYLKLSFIYFNLHLVFLKNHIVSF